MWDYSTTTLTFTAVASTTGQILNYFTPWFAMLLGAGIAVMIAATFLRYLRTAGRNAAGYR